MNQTLREAARQNLERLKANPYPGRGIVLGRNQKGCLVQLYWIMGRSENSQNRVFMNQDGRVFTEPADPSKVKDPTLIIYNAMREANQVFFVVSNGDQTDYIYKSCGFVSQDPLKDGQVGHKYEPDEPNFTPRISGVTILTGQKRMHLSMLRKSPFGEECDRFFWSYDDIPAGFGRCIHTYIGDGNPLPPFWGEPLLVPLEGMNDEILTSYWSALNPEFRVSIAMKTIPDGTYSQVEIINRFSPMRGLEC